LISVIGLNAAIQLSTGISWHPCMGWVGYWGELAVERIDCKSIGQHRARNDFCFDNCYE